MKDKKKEELIIEPNKMGETVNESEEHYRIFASYQHAIYNFRIA